MASLTLVAAWAGACGSSESIPSPGASPDGAAGAAGCPGAERAQGTEIGDTIPDLALTRIIDSGSEQPFRLHALRARCEKPGLLVVRVEPAWCSPCGMRADAVARILSPFPSDGVDTLTVVYANVDNGLPSLASVASWRVAHPSLPGVIARSPDGAARELVRRGRVVPMVFLVDRRTLQISNVLEDPDDPFFVEQVALSLREVGGPTVVLPSAAADTIDGRFDAHQWELVKQLAAPLVLPKSPSNAHADDPAAAALGQSLFDDTSLAGPSGIACSTCHVAAKGFSDGLPTAMGTARGTVNTPGLEAAAWSRYQFWDGRADSLWSQALGPLENPSETGGSRLHVAHRVRAAHAASYEAVFGPLPALDDPSRFPPAGKPGEPAYDGMSSGDRDAVTRVFVNVGKAIEAFERTLRPPSTRLEAYAAGQLDVLTPVERDGLHTFLVAGCVSCHSGPALTNGAFFNIAMPANAPAGPGDRGRIDGVEKLLKSPFRADGPYSDDPTAGAALAVLAAEEGLLGQIKTPSLRGITRTGPWGHGGTFTELEHVIRHYGQAKPAELAGPAIAGTQDPAVARFVASHNAELVAVLRVFGGE